MKEKNLVNEYGSRYGVELVFDTYREMRAYEKEHYGDEGFPNSCDVWDQVRVTVLEKEDPDGIVASLRREGYSSEDIRAMGICV